MERRSNPKSTYQCSNQHCQTAEQSSNSAALKFQHNSILIEILLLPIVILFPFQFFAFGFVFVFPFVSPFLFFSFSYLLPSLFVFSFSFLYSFSFLTFFSIFCCKPKQFVEPLIAWPAIFCAFVLRRQCCAIADMTFTMELPTFSCLLLVSLVAVRSILKSI